MAEGRKTLGFTPLWKKFAAGALATVLVVSAVPASALAADASAPAPPGQSNAQGPGNGSTPPEMPGDGQGGPGGQGGSGGGADTQSFDYSGSYSAAKTADGQEASVEGETVESSATDQNAGLAQNGGTLKLSNTTVNKSGDSTNADNCNFYGTNAGLLAVGDGSSVYVDASSLNTSSAGSNAVFATDDGTAYVNDSQISTTSQSGNARGLDATYGGTIIGNNLSIQTAGQHSAALATDRGGGYVSVANSSLSTAGSGSPLLYSTGVIEVDRVSGTASGSQIAGMEGRNSIYLSNSSLESSSNAISGSDPIKNGVIIYQSTSGDAEASSGDVAHFQAVDSSLSTSIDSGAMFYLTNTTANVLLANTTLNFDSSSVDFIDALGNDSNNWGTAGKNGATATFTLISEKVAGNIAVDDTSSVDLYLFDGTSYTGATSISSNSAADKTTADAPLTVNVGSDSSWTVTGDSTVTNLNVADGGKVVDSDGKTVSVVADGTKVVSGDSAYTVTVTGAYSTTVSRTDDNQIQSASIDRSAFDSYYGTSTSFGSSSTSSAQEAGVSAEGSHNDQAAKDENPVMSFFASLFGFLTGN